MVLDDIELVLFAFELWLLPLDLPAADRARLRDLAATSSSTSAERAELRELVGSGTPAADRARLREFLTSVQRRGCDLSRVLMVLHNVRWKAEEAEMPAVRKRFEALRKKRDAAFSAVDEGLARLSALAEDRYAPALFGSPAVDRIRVVRDTLRDLARRAAPRADNNRRGRPNKSWQGDAESDLRDLGLTRDEARQLVRLQAQRVARIMAGEPA